jgi:hypothetical protein
MPDYSIPLTQTNALLLCRYKLRRSFDKPQKLHMRPGDPEFEGRLTSEINSVDGPK